MAESDAGQAGEGSSVSPTYTYPFAASPDIIRSNQKDAYFQGVLLDQLSEILRKFYGARFMHNHTNEVRTLADLAYLGLTTFIGNRTLGEEYCDIVQVEESLELPSVRRRAGYILTTVLVPYLINRTLPSIRHRVRNALENSVAKDKEAAAKQKSRVATIKSYLLENLDTITSPSPVYAVSLALFYFNGAYYQLGKRIWGLRYIFTRTLQPSDQRVGYEVLGVLLVLQLTVQGYMHFHETVYAQREGDRSARIAASSASASRGRGNEASLDPVAYSSNNALLFESENASFEDIDAGQYRVAMMTHTPVAVEPRIDLANKEIMRWLPNRQARKCTLCLEPMKDPSSTTCGHLFCWTCICDWCKEKPECPLCRQTCLIQHVLPLRAS